MHGGCRAGNETGWADMCCQCINHRYFPVDWDRYAPATRHQPFATTVIDEET
ncbi:hypothetical protein BIFGAL_04185 [Bifidobacterium gallicum DSM 20093 = LMG 11596]|uniref:Uncharacterized protein n=1 Tax=Bifidobacterium gallicum DSM 20093 = LMG 11596 TaxID=561180 RepID=D1NWD6_9BIFI|nr:hypothetical protein BIFGAL_04185 [Bifidobacterium gallicum DSM 20093 = LMG 11596]